MLLRVVAPAVFLATACAAQAQQAVLPRGADWLKPSPSAIAAPDSAWLDLRQIESSNFTTQAAPSWVESISFVSTPGREGAPAHSVFRIRLLRPNDDCQVLFFRLFFEDDAQKHPQLIAWDESGSQVLHSGSLGEGTGLPTSTTALVPMIGVTAIDLEVPGNGRTIRGAYLDWMKTTTVLSPIHAEQRDLMPEPFAAAAPLRPLEEDAELFGTVTAPLAQETVPLAPGTTTSAAYQFELESPPLAALLTFEVASPEIDAAPEVFVNSLDVGAASLVLPDLADPGYRGLSRALLDEMKFQYTGWVRAQMLLPGTVLLAGKNDVIVMAGAGTPKSAIRSMQIQLKYLWDKSDYLLQPLK